MTRQEWLWAMGTDPREQVFRVARGCENCGFYVPAGDGKFVCRRKDLEKACRKEHAEWLKGERE